MASSQSNHGSGVPHQQMGAQWSHLQGGSVQGGQVQSAPRVDKNVDKDRYIEKYDFPYCAKVEKYEKMTKIGQVRTRFCILFLFF